MKAILALEDGVVLEGEAFGAHGETYGELVFNTSMTGYQEILTDPSYKGQIVTMTYPHIGNYGVNGKDVESARPQVEGFVVRELSSITSNYRAEKTLDQYLKEHNIPAIQGVDTRRLTKHLRDHGAQKAVLSSIDLDKKRLIQKAKESPSIVGRDLVKEVSTKAAYDFGESLAPGFEWPQKETGKERERHFVVAIDGGIKYSILRKLNQHGFQVRVVPAAATAEEILSVSPQGVLISNGPGDPEGVPYVIETVRNLIGKVPLFGICLGHQILGLALRGKTYKLKFGHRGGNQPVMDLRTGKVEITAQNHGFSVDLDSLNREEVECTHINLDDKTLEGIRHKKCPVFGVQYHPESSPGPHDSDYLYERFYAMVDRGTW